MTTFTQGQLDDMVRPPNERIQRVISSNDLQAAAALYDELSYRFHEAIELYGRWAAAMICHLSLEYGVSVAERACRIENLFIGASTAGVVAGQLGLGAAAARTASSEESIRDEIFELISSGAKTEALTRWHELVASYRSVHDLRRDWVTEILSEIYRLFGTEGLEQALRYAYGSAWISHAADESQSLEELLPIWAAKMTLGHHGSVTIREHDAGWTLTLDPCGSCGRQVREGRYTSFVDFEIVQEPCPITFSKTGISVYQTHLAVIHGLIGIERTGVPSPAIDCSGTTGGFCELTIYRRPADVPPEHYSAVGHQPPSSETAR